MAISIAIVTAHVNLRRRLCCDAKHFNKTQRPMRVSYGGIGRRAGFVRDTTEVGVRAVLPRYATNTHAAYCYIVAAADVGHLADNAIQMTVTPRRQSECYFRPRCRGEIGCE